MHIEVKNDPAVNLWEQLQKFKRERGIHFVLAFSGGADDSNSLLDYARSEITNSLEGEAAERALEAINNSGKVMVRQIVTEILEPLRGYRIAILTGGTKWGVPSVAAITAKELGFATIGTYPLVAEQKGYNLGQDILDLSFCVHPQIGESRWGDESPLYTRCLDAVVIIGGGAGTMIEVALLLKRNEKVDLPVKPIIPIVGTGGTADQVLSFPGKPLTMSRCLPPQPIVSGTDAGRYLRHEIFHEAVFDN